MRVFRWFLLSGVMVALCFVGLGWAGGSEVKGVVVNKSKVKGAINAALGATMGSTEANMGTTKIEKSNIKGVVANQSEVKGGINAALGATMSHTEANMGTVKVK